MNRFFLALFVVGFAINAALGQGPGPGDHPKPTSEEVKALLLELIKNQELNPVEDDLDREVVLDRFRELVDEWQASVPVAEPEAGAGPNIPDAAAEAPALDATPTGESVPGGLVETSMSEPAAAMVDTMKHATPPVGESISVDELPVVLPISESTTAGGVEARIAQIESEIREINSKLMWLYKEMGRLRHSPGN